MNNNPWKLYDELIAAIPSEITVTDYQAGHIWSRVVSSEGSTGIGMSIPVQTRPVISSAQNLIGAPVSDVAQLVKSWDFVEASIGLAAINSYYNHPERVEQCGFVHPSVTDKVLDAFDVYYEEVAGKNVAVVGHFPFLEKRFAGHCNLSILERSPLIGDYPDSACEYILGEQDYVFITGCTMVNKTFPRLLELSRHGKVVMVGPSTPLAPVMFKHGVFGLSGFVTTDSAKLESALRGADSAGLFNAGIMVDQMQDR